MRSPLIACAVLLSMGLASPSAARPRAEPVEWTIGHDRYRGMLVYDDEGEARRPGLLMVPNWMGVTDDAVATARKIAGNDYVVLVADVYGAGVRPQDSKEAGAIAGALRGDRPLLRKRSLQAMEALKAQAGKAPVDADRIGALGFCFGGTAVLEMARAGAPLAGVASLHGNLSTPLPAEAGAVKAPVLVLNGAADRGVSREDVAAFGKEMDAAGADWQFVDFGGAVHCFAEPSAGNDPASNCRYDERAARRAYRMLEDFFQEQFGG
ncbi:dienelactone hydrolase family protein [Pseudoxanthomonas suwonensis]|uniref:dienelactone hydrolase family protein n=1 Tax=Pseudoxanthomonas suwonensis TaxID=314722 RepID=UPI0004B4C7AF|nr:dienelactone hydrolase family protein [Pseudoxanthomonas suwonensis]